MRKLTVFNNVSLDGYFTDKNSDMNWAKAGNDDEFNDFTASNASGGGTLVFGRVTYDLMANFWPTPMAAKMMPEVAAGMNRSPKIVFSRTMSEASWSNTTVIKGELISEVRKLKSQSGPGMVILGSGSIIAQLAPAGLIDQYQIVLCPVALGAGRTIFQGVNHLLGFKLANSRIFKNGKVFLSYEPA